MSTYMAVFNLYCLARQAGHAWAGKPPKETIQFLKDNAPFSDLRIESKPPSVETQVLIRDWFPEIPDFPLDTWEEADPPVSEVDCWARYALALIMSEGAPARTKVGPTWRFTPWSRPFTWDIDPETAVTLITVKDGAGPVLRATMDGCVVTVDVLRQYTTEQLEILTGLVNATGRVIAAGLWAMAIDPIPGLKEVTKDDPKWSALFQAGPAKSGTFGASSLHIPWEAIYEHRKAVHNR